MAEWISIISRQTSTIYTMVDILTFSIWSTRSWTRVDTFLTDTGQVTGAVQVDAALWPTARWVSDRVGKTGADCRV